MGGIRGNVVVGRCLAPDGCICAVHLECGPLVKNT